MIVKELEIPLRLRKVTALRERLNEKHPKYKIVDDEFRKRMSGYNGEKSLKYFLSLLDKKQYRIFHGLRIPDPTNDHFFEIDTLVASPTYFLNIESKNHRGELYFDHVFDQMIQTYDDKKISYSSPLAQISRQQFQLKRLLELYDYPLAPVQSLLVLTNPSAIISASPGHPQVNKIIRSTNLIQKTTQFEKQYKNEVFSGKLLLKLSKQLLKLDTPYDADILQKFGIGADESVKGVRCPKCNAIPMKRTQRKWDCNHCGFSSPNAHLDSITDYKLLFGNKITNQQLRNFLLLPSSSAATRILNSTCESFYGHTKGRVYILPKIISQTTDVTST